MRPSPGTRAKAGNPEEEHAIELEASTGKSLGVSKVGVSGKATCVRWEKTLCLARRKKLADRVERDKVVNNWGIC